MLERLVLIYQPFFISFGYVNLYYYICDMNYNKIHIFNEIWTIGKLTVPKKSNKYHCVIKGPNRKEYHYYGKEAENLYDYNQRVDIAKVKIHILSHIISPGIWKSVDNKPNESTFMLIIYDNGTIKHKLYEGVFHNESIPRYVHDDNGKKIAKYDNQKIIKPVIYKI